MKTDWGVVKTMPDVEFELYFDTNSNSPDEPVSPVPCYVTTATDAQTSKPYFAYSRTDTTSNTVKSDENGIIDIRNLPLNHYYLKEKNLTGYNVSDNQKIQFTLGVDNSNVVQHINNQAISNTEVTSTLKLQKQDPVNNNALAHASFYLLREIPSDVTITPDFTDLAGDGRKWKIARRDQTDENGILTFDNLNFGTYLFYEVQAPVGYEVNNTNLVPISINAGNAGTEAEIFTQTRTDPRKTAHVKILKTDENGEPLQGAEYELYKVKTGNETEDTLININIKPITTV